MRYHLETIPVWDAVKREGECPLCDLAGDLEHQAVESMLGGAVMEPDQRVETNRLGFCARHLDLLYAEKNRLGLALMAHTHMGDVAVTQRQALESLAAAIRKEAEGGVLKRAAGAVGHGGPVALAARSAARSFRERAGTCFICARIEGNMERYAATILHMWKAEKEFTAALASSKGFCHPHAADLLDRAADQLSGADLRGFFTLLSELQERKNARLLSELEWFTLKFDFRNRDKPWGESKDALPRGMDMLRGASLRGGRQDKG